MSPTSQFLARAVSAYNNKQGHLLLETLLPDLGAPEVAAIAQELLQEHVNIRAKVLESLPNDSQIRLADLMGTVLQYIWDAAVNGGDAVRMALYTSLRMSKIYESATKMFALPDSGWFNPCIQVLTLALLESTVKTDRAREDNSSDRLVAAITTVTNGPLKIAASDTKRISSYRSPPTGYHILARESSPSALLRGDAFDSSFTLGFSKTFKLRDTLASAEPILGFLAPQMGNLRLFIKAEQVTFHYYVGSVFLAKEELRPARDHLQLAFDSCTSYSPKNKRLIFINLVTVSILLGIFPHPQLLAAFDLIEYFFPLIRAIKLGDRSAFRIHLDQHMEWFRRRCIYLILRAKGEVLVLRSLFRRTILLARRMWPPENEGQPPTIQFDHLLAAVRISYRYPAVGDMELSTWDTVDIEALCASLIDQGYIQGYLLHSRACLVVRKGPTLGFPLIPSVAVWNED